jgi:hypothetical protein
LVSAPMEEGIVVSWLLYAERSVSLTREQRAGGRAWILFCPRLSCSMLVSRAMRGETEASSLAPRCSLRR